jgi:aspartyl-tRNA synthetase
LPRLKYAMRWRATASDKPDTRFGLELVDLSDIFQKSEFSVFQNALSNGGSIRAVNAKGASEHFSRKELDAMGEFVKTYRAKGLIWMNDKAEGLASPC